MVLQVSKLYLGRQAVMYQQQMAQLGVFSARAQRSEDRPEEIMECTEQTLVRNLKSMH